MNTSLRKAAILISTLEMRAADALLDQMPPEQAAQVRGSIMNLGDISPAEQEQVIAECLRGNGAESGGDDGGLEIDPALARRLEAELPDDPALLPTGSDWAADARQSPALPPFHFLRPVGAAAIAAILRSEQPQTIAVVISRLPPEQAAGVLEALPAALSTDALERMAWLDELDPQVLRDLEQQLERALAAHLEANCREPRGLNTVSAVLSALSGQRRNEALQGLAARDEQLLRRLGYPGGTVDASAASPAEREAVNPAANLVAAHYRQAREPALDMEFDRLCTLSDADLRQVFAAVEPTVALLALTGAAESVRRRILRQLPGRQAELLRQKLNHPGPLRLSDIEAAQQELARAAGRLAARGMIHLSGQRFAAAA
jgi:flagellar motor switch protein FliG